MPALLEVSSGDETYPQTSAPPVISTITGGAERGRQGRKPAWPKV